MIANNSVLGERRKIATNEPLDTYEIFAIRRIYIYIYIGVEHLRAV